MKIKTSKSILISDPCYILDDTDYDEFIDDESVDVLGRYFSDYELEDTGVGDGGWEVYEIEGTHTLDEMDKLIHRCIESGERPGKKIGEYSADSGMIAVFLEPDVRSYTEFPKDLIEKGCICRIPHFTGEIYPVFDQNNELHYVGISQSNAFYSI